MTGLGGNVLEGHSKLSAVDNGVQLRNSRSVLSQLVGKGSFYINVIWH